MRGGSDPRFAGRHRRVRRHFVARDAADMPMPGAPNGGLGSTFIIGTENWGNYKSVKNDPQRGYAKAGDPGWPYYLEPGNMDGIEYRPPPPPKLLRLRRDERGAGAVEFALSVPILITLFVGLGRRLDARA